MCIKLQGRKFISVDDLKVEDKDAFVIVQVVEQLEGSPGEFRFSEDYVFRCTEQIIIRPQIPNLNENITLYRERLEENTVNELKYFCKENLLPRVGSKSELIPRVQSNLRKRKLEVIELRVKKSQN